MFDGLLDGLGDVFLDECVLLAGPPIGDLRETGAAKVCIDYRIRTLVGGKEGKQVLDPTLLERSSEMIHRCLSKVGPQDHRQDLHRNVFNLKKTWMRERV